ncbi:MULTISPECIES: PIN domain-containing protein [Burkholderia]|uniref:PIN domain-containing protein n=1 Tax=Burkholderia TaxID=32008 RepID=UPI00158B97B8|nr:PIN domain-containing protein [Burkholderia cepacia]MCA8058831.1 PIN domain-containing protein [Burkholderia cepacia]MCA8135049.1 PIN domain-containing protein [Burkholderia cepacia]MCA8161240.1 PIN domain-containing protein [Burkholderia cepacia]HEM7891657.1 DUF4935 domain-containing protein [Burkholderia cepacia]HEM8512546.1 DUF4935 domain-containing protein [Burkholderia cepacia]
MAMHLFIDTNIYLSFYHHSKDDLESLEELMIEIVDKHIVLHLPQQVSEEIERNRDVKLNTAVNEFKKISLNVAIPRHMLSMATAETYATAIADAKQARDHLIAQATAKARLLELDVDVWLSFLYSLAKRHEHDDAIFARGKVRAERGNPPGKNGSLGDQYNWEMLLEKLPDTDLYIVSRDGDYMSAFEGSDSAVYPNAFLKREWATRKGGKALYVFETIKGVLDHYTKILAKAEAPKEADAKEKAGAQGPKKAKDQTEAHGTAAVKATSELGDIQSSDMSKVLKIHFGSQDEFKSELSKEQNDEKEAAIKELEMSPNFATTHAVIKELQKFDGHFSTDEVNALFKTAVTNNQVGWIIEDDDVNKFYLGLVSSHTADADSDLVDAIIQKLKLSTDQESSGDGPQSDDSTWADLLKP